VANKKPGDTGFNYYQNRVNSHYEQNAFKCQQEVRARVAETFALFRGFLTGMVWTTGYLCDYIIPKKLLVERTTNKYKTG